MRYSLLSAASLSFAFAFKIARFPSFSSHHSLTLMSICSNARAMILLVRQHKCASPGNNNYSIMHSQSAKLIYPPPST